MTETDVYFDVEFDHDIAIITMCRRENKINEQFMEKFHAALDTVLRNPAVKALITTGTGRFYNNGVDVDYTNTLPDQELNNLHDKLSSVFARIMTFPLPTVAAINGHAYGAGGIFALIHDHVIMQTKRGWWCLNEVHLKIQMRRDVIMLLKGKLNQGRALQETVVLGRRFTAEEALSAGIVHEICAPEDLMPRAVTWIRNNLPKSGYDRGHLQLMKQDLYKDVVNTLQGKTAKL